MQITESQLRRIVRQTIVEENRKRILRETVMSRLASRPMAIFGLMMALSGCTGKSIKPEDTHSPETQIAWVEEAGTEMAEEPETYEEAVARINAMEGVSEADKQMLIGHLKFLKAAQNTQKGIERAIAPMK